MGATDASNVYGTFPEHPMYAFALESRVPVRMYGQSTLAFLPLHNATNQHVQDRNCIILACPASMRIHRHQNGLCELIIQPTISHAYSVNKRKDICDIALNSISSANYVFSS